MQMTKRTRMIFMVIGIRMQINASPLIYIVTKGMIIVSIYYFINLAATSNMLSGL